MKKYLKKSLSVFMAFLMVLSCFVFSPEMFTFEADAAQQGKYYVTFLIYIADCSDNKGNYLECNYVDQYGNETKNHRLWTAITDKMDDYKEQVVEYKTELPGVPTAFKYSNYGIWLGGSGWYVRGIKVSPNSDYSNSVTLWTGDIGMQLDRVGGATVSGTFDIVNNKFSGWSKSYGSNKKTDSTYTISPLKPTPTSIEWTPSTDTYNVLIPGGESTNSSKSNTVTFKEGSTVYDQYGVSWYQPANYELFADEEMKQSLSSMGGLSVKTEGKASTAPVADVGTVTVSDNDALKQFVSEGPTESGTIATNRNVYAFAYFTYNNKTFYAHKAGTEDYGYAIVNIENPQYKWTFQADESNPTTDEIGQFTDDKEDHSVTQYYGTTLSDEQIPGVIKTGYDFSFYYSSDYLSIDPKDGKLVPGSTKFLKNATWTANWDPIINKVAFYNYNGQPIKEINAYYNEMLQTVMFHNGIYYDGNNGVLPPTRPSTSAGTYEFVRWVDWETGEPLDLEEQLKSTDSVKVRKFIAEYKVASSTKYTYQFYSDGVIIGSGKGTYRDPITFPINQTKETEYGKNGKKYDFAGWIVETADENSPEDLIVDTTSGKTLESETAGKTFLSLEEAKDGNFTYYLRDNVKLYPVYVASYKPVKITLNYVDANGDWQQTVIDDEKNTCQTQFDLGIPNPKSYNDDLNSYTFIGWASASNATEPDTNLKLGANNEINITLEDDCEFWAIYEKKALEYKAYYYIDGKLAGEQNIKKNEAFNLGFDDRSGESVVIETAKDRVDMKGYIFKGWSLTAPDAVDANGNKIDQVTVDNTTYTLTTNVNPTFYAVYKEYDYYEITFLDEDGEEIMSSKDYVKGNKIMPSTTKDEELTKYFIQPSIADKAASDKYSYVFKGWKDESRVTTYSKDEPIVVGGEGHDYQSITLKPYFEEEIRNYTIKFYDVKGQTFDENDKDKETSEPLYTVTLPYGTNLSTWFEKKVSEDENALTYAETIQNLVVGAESFPESNERYTNTFTGWWPTINSASEVKGDAVYRATYKTTSVEYKVTWLVPKLDADNKVTYKPQSTATYFYNASIIAPSTKPTFDQPSKDSEDYKNNDEYTWSFLGWYKADENGNTLDKDGKITTNEAEMVKFAKGTPANDVNGLYFVARFGYIANEFAVTILGEDKTTVLDVLDGKSFDEEIEIDVTNYVKNPTDKYHYTVSSLCLLSADVTDAEGNVTSGTVITVTKGVAKYTVSTDNKLYVVYTQAEHTFGDWTVELEPTYAEKGREEQICDCGYIASRDIPMLVDDQAPYGYINIAGYSWDATADTTKPAYIRNDLLVNIVTRDLGQKSYHDDATAGSGIYTIKYRWVDPTVTEDPDAEKVVYTTKEVSKKYITNENLSFSLPSDFTDKYLEVVVTDYEEHSYTMRTPVLREDTQKPVIYEYHDCENIVFAIDEAYEIDKVKVERYDESTGEWVEIDYEGDMVDALEAGTDFNRTYMIIKPNGKYRITATDMAGNVSATTNIEVNGEHVYGDYIVTKEATCKEEGYQHKQCKYCDETGYYETIEKKAHTWNTDYTVDEAATCEKDGSQSIHCKNCDAKRPDSTQTIKAKGHDEVETKVAPTCTKDGYKLVTCKNCDLWELTTAVEDPAYKAKGHTADKADATKHFHKDATCTEDGYDYYLCKDCNAKCEEKTINALGHDTSEGAKNVTPEDACHGNEGKGGMFYSAWECKTCGATVEVNPELKEHSYGEGVYTEPTCTEDGYTTYTCTREGCDHSYKEVDRLSSFGGHQYDYENSIVDKEPTCEEAGSQHYKCKHCEAITEPEEITALGHNMTVVEEKSKPATCGSDGLEFKKCTNAGCTHTEETVLTKTGVHVYEKELDKNDKNNYQAPTCTDAGWQKWQCTGCDMTETRTIDATGHKQGEEVSRVPATCKATGTVTYKCLNGEHEYTETLPIDKNAHDATDGATVVKVIKKATCTEKGEEIRNCKLCSSTATVETKELGHDYTKWVVVTEATCKTDGLKKKVCSRCDAEQHKTTTDAEGNIVETEELVTEKIEATGKHTLKLHAKVDATCTADGTEAYYECTVCKKLFSDEDAQTGITAPTQIKAEGHKYDKDGEDDKYVVVAPTCKADGYKYKVCTVCGEKTAPEETGEKALNHKGGDRTLVKVNKAATCTTAGKGVYQCSLCGETFVGDIEIDPNAHSIVRVTTPATCEGDGKRVKKCEYCNYEKTETISALGHAWKITTETKYEDGKIKTREVKTCTRCSKVENGEWGVAGEACKITFNVVDTTVTPNTTTTSEITKDKGAKLKKSDLPSVDLTSSKDGYKKSVVWTVGGSEAKFPLEVNGNITVVGTIKEEELSYTVSFVNTLSKETVKSDSYSYNEKVTAPDDLVVPGYTFGGWSVSPSDATVTKYSKDTIPNATADVTYYAVFTAIAGAKTYYVTFKNGTKTISSEIVSQGETVIALETNPTKTANSVFHYTFAGWTDKDGKAVTFPMTVTTNVTVYAKFNEVKHSDRKEIVVGSIKAATCTNPGEWTYKCKDCGYEWVYYTDEALGHDYQEVSRVDADGKLTVTYKCSRCEETWTKTVVYNVNANIVVITVKDTAGNAVEGANVQLYLGDFQTATAVTDANGQAKFPKYDAEKAPNGIKDGKYTVKVTKTGYNTASGTLVVQDGTGSISLTFAKIDCHCICHSSNVFGKIRRFFNKLFRLFNKNYTCCSCGECEVIHS